MAINYNFTNGSDFPAWQWLPFLPVPGYGGFDTDYDGSRYIYVAVQSGSTATSASTSQLWRYDTWGQGWQLLATLTSGNRGMTLVYDKIRNVVIVANGAALTSWQVFNLNATSVNICGVACAAWTATTMTPVLPAAAEYGAALTVTNPNDIPATIESSTLTTGTTTTTLLDSAADSSFTDQMVGMQIKLTSGAISGERRFISSVTDKNTLVVGSAFSQTPAAGVSYIIELPSGTASSGSSTTLVDSTATWTVNQYSNSDVVILTGTGAGQRRRIASNTATTLTLASAVTGNANTGNWTTPPDATSTYKIQPSSDFVYYSPGSTGSGFYKIDLATGASATTWTTLTSATAASGGGGNLMFPNYAGAFNMILMRGAVTATFYQYNIGLNSWSTLSTRAGVETFTTGAYSTIWDGHRRLIIQKEGVNRLYALNLGTRELEPFATIPYAAPGAYCGKRLRVVTLPNGTQWLYVWRGGGSEFFRVPLEWGN